MVSTKHASIGHWSDFSTWEDVGSEEVGKATYVGRLGLLPPNGGPNSSVWLV